MKIVSALAHPNIALVKYWGKRDLNLILPLNSSISVTLANLASHTTIHLDPKLSIDSLKLNDQEISPESKVFQEYFNSYLKIMRYKFKFTEKLRIITKNNFPTSAGLASSASGFAALSVALNEALGLGLDYKKLSQMARMGSGSATRSILGGFNYWQMGVAPDGSDSEIGFIADQQHWPELCIAIAITATGEKIYSSREGMQRTVKTCPIYQTAWLDTVKKDLQDMEQAILSKNFTLMGTVAEKNALKMHATMIASTPPINYWNEATKLITNTIVELRENNRLESYFTIDAGPQVKILYQKKDQLKVENYLGKLVGLKEIIYTNVGSAATVINHHLE